MCTSERAFQRFDRRGAFFARRFWTGSLSSVLHSMSASVPSFFLSQFKRRDHRGFVQDRGDSSYLAVSTQMFVGGLSSVSVSVNCGASLRPTPSYMVGNRES